MGIRLIKKGDPGKRKKDPKIALVLAGGAISGGGFKVGGLKALDDFLTNKKITDFDLYVGLSAGAFLAAPLANGVSPAEMLKALAGDSEEFSQLRPTDFYNPNLAEFVKRPLRFAFDVAAFFPGFWYDILTALPDFPAEVSVAAKRFLQDRSYSNFEDVLQEIFKVVSPRREVPSIARALPSGIFDNSSLERYMRENLERNGMPNDFLTLYEKRKKELYIAAMNLDTAEQVIFGTFERQDVTISEAIQASTALPGFYKPARIAGVDYVDGGVRHTANIGVAVEHGADLIICYNPFRPFVNRIEIEEAGNGGRKYRVTRGRRIADRGLRTIMGQVFRTLLHSRLEYGLKHFAEDVRFQGDIILIEPRETDYRFFDINPLAFWARTEAAEHGYLSVRDSIERKYGEVEAILNAYGIEMSHPEEVAAVKQLRPRAAARASSKSRTRYARANKNVVPLVRTRKK